MTKSCPKQSNSLENHVEVNFEDVFSSNKQEELAVFLKNPVLQFGYVIIHLNLHHSLLTGEKHSSEIHSQGLTRGKNHHRKNLSKFFAISAKDFRKVKSFGYFLNIISSLVGELL